MIGSVKNKSDEVIADSDLLERIADGDAGAARTLFEKYYGRIFRFVMRQVAREHVVEDLTNEVFLDVWRQAGQFAGRSSVATWILTIARNKTVAYRRNNREVPLEKGHVEIIDEWSDGPETTCQKCSKAREIRKAIDKLSLDHKMVIDLIFFHEMTIQEVSLILGIPVNTVKTRAFHARKKLGELLRKAGIDRGWP